MKIVDKLYQFIVFIQLVFFFVFLLENFNNLGTIEYGIGAISSGIFSGTTVVINYYALLGLLSFLIVLVILIGFQIAGSGISETGSKIFNKYIFLLAFYTLLSSSSVYYLLSLGITGLIIQFIITVIWVLHSLVFFQTTTDND